MSSKMRWKPITRRARPNLLRKRRRNFHDSGKAERESRSREGRHGRHQVASARCDVSIHGLGQSFYAICTFRKEGVHSTRAKVVRQVVWDGVGSWEK